MILVLVAGLLDLVRSGSRNGGVRTSGGGAAAHAGAAARPNVILIVTDDQRWDSVWSMPNVRHDLQDHGVTFTNAFVTTSFCCPSRASILTGQYSHHTGVYSDRGPNGGAPAFRDTSTVATWLQGAGYRTALVGKYLNEYNLMAHHIPPGWSQWDALANADPALHYYDYTMNQNGRLVHYGSRPRDYADTVLGSIALRFVQTARPPFFLEFAPIAPHLPAPPAPGDRGRFAGTALPMRPNYNEADVGDKPWSGMFRPLLPADAVTLRTYWDTALASLQDVDRSIGSMVAALRADGQLRNTVFLFTSDNGMLLGEHRLGERKIWPYEESIRVPLVVAGAGISDPGRRSPDLALNIDIAPTIAQLAGVRPGLPQDGRSLVPLLRNEHPPWRRAFVVEYLGAGNHGDGFVAPFDGIRTTRYLYVRYGPLRMVPGEPRVPYPNGTRELYDLARDPYELQNIAADPAEAALRARLGAELQRLLRRPAGA